MKFLFDQNISHKILKHLPEKFPVSTTIKKEKLINSQDTEIWNFAKANNYTIITQDSDFNDLASWQGFPPKVIWIRAGNIKTKDIAVLLEKNLDEINSFLDNSEYGVLELINFNA